MWNAMEYYSAIQKEYNLSICNDMDGARQYIMLSKINHSEKDKYHMLPLRWHLGNKTNEQRGKRQMKKQTLNYGEQFVGYGSREWIK